MMFSYTSGLASAICFLFFAVCVAEDPFPVVMKRIQSDLHGMTQALSNLGNISGPVKFDDLKEIHKLIQLQRDVDSDLSILPRNVTQYLLTSADSIRNVSTSLDEVNHQFVFAVEPHIIQTIQMTKKNYDPGMPHSILGLFRNHIETIFKPYLQLLNNWRPNMRDFSIGEQFMLRELLEDGSARLMTSLQELMARLIDMQDSYGEKLGVLGPEIPNWFTRVFDSVCPIRREILCVGECDKLMMDMNKFFAKCRQ